MDLSSIPLVDQHAHNLLLPEAAARVPFRSAFTEAYDPVVLNEQCTGTLYFRRSLRDIGELLDCPPTEEAILARRAELGEIALAERCFRASNLEMVLMEDGFLPGQIRPIEWHAQFFPVRRLVRLETVAEELLGSARSFEDHVDRFRAAIEPASSRAVGFKTIIAYRTGLDVGPVNAEAARAAWGGWKAAQGSLPRPRLTDKALLDFLLEQGLEVAARHRLPLQIHTGFGDPDLDLRLANPLHLRRLLEDPRFKTAAFVLLHASYPFTREGGYLASVYPHAYLDMGLMVAFLSVAGMREATRALLELAPTEKLMYSSDAHVTPELYDLGARLGAARTGAVPRRERPRRQPDAG